MRRKISSQVRVCDGRFVTGSIMRKSRLECNYRGVACRPDHRRNSYKDVKCQLMKILLTSLTILSLFLSGCIRETRYPKKEAQQRAKILRDENRGGEAQVLEERAKSLPEKETYSRF